MGNRERECQIDVQIIRSLCLEREKRRKEDKRKESKEIEGGRGERENTIRK